MDDVHGAAGLAGEPISERDGGVFPGGGRDRGSPRRRADRHRRRQRRAPRSSSACASSGSPRRAGQRHGRAQIGLGGVGELVDARVHQERLAAEHARRRRARPARRVARDDAAPEADVDGSCRGTRAASVEGGAGRGDGDAVERHVDERWSPARGRRARGRGEPLPLGAPGSFTCTWQSTSPGAMTRVPRSSTGISGGTVAVAGLETSARMRPSSMSTVPGRMRPSGPTMRRLRSPHSPG